MILIKTQEELEAAVWLCGGLVPVWLAAIEAGVSRQRMDQLLEGGRIGAFQYQGARWVSLKGAIMWGLVDHKRLNGYRTLCAELTRDDVEEAVDEKWAWRNDECGEGVAFGKESGCWVPITVLASKQVGTVEVRR